MKRFFLASLVFGVAVSIINISHAISILKPFPPQTGPYQVGTQAIEWIDQKRAEAYADNPAEKRRIVAHIYYPANNANALKKAPYLGAKMSEIQKQFAAYYHVPEWLSRFLLRDISTNAYTNAPLSTQNNNYPVVLFSHGLFSMPDVYTALLEDLASHGYIVVSIDHAYLNMLTFCPDGTAVSSQAFAEQFEKLSPIEQREFQTKAIEIYKADMQFVLDQLRVLDQDKQSAFYDRFDFTRVGVMGHSAGGTAAIEFCRTDKRIKACVDLDGWYDHIIGSKPLSAPLLLMWAEKSREITEPTAEYLKRKQETKEQYYARQNAVTKHQNELCQNSADCRTIIVPHATHGDFSDEILLRWPLRPWNAVDAYKTIRFVNERIAQFFDKYLQMKQACFIQSVDAPAIRRAYELVDLINANDRMKTKFYIEKNYNQKLLKMPVDMLIGPMLGIYDITHGIKTKCIKEYTATHAELLVSSSLTSDQFIFVIDTDAVEPHLIAGVKFRPYTEKVCIKKLHKKEVVAELDQYMKKLVAADIFSGNILIAEHGKPFYTRSFGQANKDFNVANTIDTKFNLGSMNKMFTAVAIAQLVEQGKLSFEDTLDKFFPDLPNAEDAKKIKIKHLLTHTSGLGSYFNQKFNESSRALFRTVDDMMKLIDDTKVAFEPGSKWQYSNVGFLVLGAIVEKVIDQSYFDYIRENIYKPAGMTNTDSYELDRVNPNLAVGYSKEFGANGTYFRNNIFQHVLRGGPAGGGYSTVKDLLKFDQALRMNTLLGPELKEQVFTAKPELSSPAYGYGFKVNNQTNSVGHSGGFSGINSHLTMYQKSGYTVVILSNYSDGANLVAAKSKHLVSCIL